MLNNTRRFTVLIMSVIMALSQPFAAAAAEDVAAPVFFDESPGEILTDSPGTAFAQSPVVESPAGEDAAVESIAGEGDAEGLPSPESDKDKKDRVEVIQSKDLIFVHETVDYDEVRNRIVDADTLEEGAFGEEEVLGAAVYFDDFEKYSSYTYYNRLDEDMQYAWDRLTLLGNYYLRNKDDLYEGTEYAYTDYVCVGTLDGDRLYTLYNLWSRNNPQYFYLLSGFSSMSRNGLSYVAPMAYLKFADGSERAAAAEQVFSKVKTLTDEIGAEGDDYGKLVKAHDLICKSVVYNTAGANNIGLGDFEFTQSCYSTFITGTTVCAGYAAAYALLCNYFDIETAVVVSDTHAWNLVRLGGRYYNVDVTWDDGKKINYRYFLKSDGSVRSGNSDHEPRSGIVEFYNYTPSADTDSASAASPACPVMPGLTAAAPVITVEKGRDRDFITMTSATEGARIYFTLDDTDPSTGNTKAFLYTQTVGVRGKVRAVATAEGYYDSPVSEQRLSYIIDYQLNEGINSSANPPHYHQDDPDITLMEPSRQNYKFKGWFTDENLTQEIKVIKCSDAKDLVLYAGWEFDSGPGESSESGTGGTGLDGEVDVDPGRIPSDTDDDGKPSDSDSGSSNESILGINGYRFRQTGWRLEDGVYKSYYYVLDVFYYTGFTYSGRAIRPKVFVYDELKDKWLSRGKSFKVSYHSNKNASSRARIRVKGAGSYKGFDTSACSGGAMYFTIYPITFNNSNLLIPDYSVAYKEGKVQQKPPKDVYLGSVKLSKKDFVTEYTGRAVTSVSGNLIYKNAKDAYMAPGSYEVLLKTGKSGNILGSKSVVMTVSDKLPVSKLKVRYQKSWGETGGAIRPEAAVYLKGERLSADRDYTVSYHNNYNKGTGLMVIRGRGDYTGVTVKKFRIK